MSFVKLPQGEWIDLAYVRSVEVQEEPDSLVPAIDRVLVRLLLDTGKSKAYCGAKVAAILEALTETAYIDKSQISARSAGSNPTSELARSRVCSKAADLLFRELVKELG